MAICHFAVKHASRGQGRSALAHATYIAREGPYAQGRFAEQFVHVEHHNMPPWAQADPHAFWAAADTYERANGRLYNELEMALPRELSADDRLTLAREFIDRQIGPAHPCTWALHVSQALDGGEQPHVHVMFSARTLDGIARGPGRFFRRATPATPALGGAAKDPAWHERAKVLELREAWAATANHALERAGVAARLDPRSLAAQGIDRLPEPKLGPERTALLRRGIETPEGAQVLDLRAYRERLGRVERAVAHAQGQVIDLAQARAEREARAQEPAARQTQDLAREHEQAEQLAQEQEHAQAERQAQEQARAEREAQARAQAARQAQELARERETPEDAQERESQAREQAEREAQERTLSDPLSPEEAARVEQLLAEEPAWRAAQDEARIQRLLAQLENPEARVEAILQREALWHALQLEQARQHLTHATGREHLFAHAALVTGRLIDQVELAGDDFGRVLDRHGCLLLVPWTREMAQHLEQSVALQLTTERHGTRVLGVAQERVQEHAQERAQERDRGLGLGF